MSEMLKPTPTQSFRVKSIGLFISISLIMLGCAPTTSQLAVGEDVADLKVQYLKGNYDTVIRSGEKLDLKSRKPEILQALYYTGVSLLVKKRCDEARVYLEAVRKNDRTKKLRDQAALRIADSYYIEGKRDKAFNLYKQFLRDYPKSPLLPSVYGKLAAISQEMGRFEQAEQYRDILKKRYPTSIEVQELGRGEEKLDYYTVQVGAFFDEDNAKQLKLELEVLGYQPSIVVIKKDNTKLYRVRVGEFKTQAEAAYTAGQLEARGYPAKISP